MDKLTKILQLKISLDGIKPEIWRRFLVEDSISFHQLHNIIQKIMGWENYHAYEFYNESKKTLIEGESEYSFCVDAMWKEMRQVKKKVIQKSARNAVLSEFLNKENDELMYVYDLGDSWEHIIKIERIAEYDKETKYPLCTAGERACPPEDCGSVPGYYELMKIRKNPRHREYKERIIEWLGKDYDPELFIVDWINAELHGKKPKPVWMWKGETPADEVIDNKIERKRKLGRNEACHCGSGIKYKKCCLDKDIRKTGELMRVGY